jgi:pilus assembly protein CpaB
MNVARRIQQNPGALVVVGVGLIAAALVLIWLNLSARNEASVSSAEAPAVADRPASSEVIVAMRDIVRGQAITSGDLTTRRLEGTAPGGSFADREQIIGRVATRDIRASQLVLNADLSADPVNAGIAALVPEGQRAFAIRVAEEDIAGGFLQAGDHVDVFVTLPGAVYGQQAGLGGPREDQSKSALLLQDMQVLAVGPELSPRNGGTQGAARTVTLAAPPAALARLALAGRLGQVTLAIRNPGDKEMAAAEIVDLNDLRPGTAPVADRKGEDEAAPQRHRVTIYSGASQTTVTTSR